jgi:poly-gamma-glutamate synthesis protein (capsule biosynthesis protein)
MDSGRDGLRQTQAALRSEGISHFGGLADKAVRPWTTTINDLRLAFFGVDFIRGTRGAPGVTTLPAHQHAMVRAMQAARDEGAIVIVLPHWGNEYTGEVTANQRQWARWFIHHGAAAVIGSHSHHPQPMDVYQGRPIVYSLGNLVFPGRGPNPGFRSRKVAYLTVSRYGGALGCTMRVR